MTADEKPSASQIGSWLASQRQTFAKACAWCGGPFTGIKMRRYCSAVCRRVAAHRKRRSKAGGRGET